MKSDSVQKVFRVCDKRMWQTLDIQKFPSIRFKKYENALNTTVFQHTHRLIKFPETHTIIAEIQT